MTAPKTHPEEPAEGDPDVPRDDPGADEGRSTSSTTRGDGAGAAVEDGGT